MPTSHPERPVVAADSGGPEARFVMTATRAMSLPGVKKASGPILCLVTKHQINPQPKSTPGLSPQDRLSPKQTEGVLPKYRHSSFFIEEVEMIPRVAERLAIGAVALDIW